MKFRMLSLILAATLMLPMLAACSSRPKPELSRVTHVYKSKDISLPDNISTSSGSMYLVGGELMIRATEILDEGPYENREQAENARREVMLKLDIATGDYTMEPLPKLGANRYINYVLPVEDGYLLIINSYDEKQGTEQFSVECWDGKAFTVLSDNVQALFDANPEEAEFGFRNFYLQYIQTDGDGNIYLATDGLLGVFDAAMKKLFEIELPGWIDTLGKSADGRVFIQYYDRQNGGQVLRYIDPAKKDFGEHLEIPASDRFLNAEFYTGSGYDMYISDDQSVWGYNVGSEPVELLNWVNSDIIADGIRDLAIVDENTFIANYYEYHEEGTVRELYILERVPDEEVPERYVIDLAVHYMNYELPSKVVRFNRNNDEYRVRITDYSQYVTDENFEAGAERLYNDIKAGTGPDVISLANFNNSAVLIEEEIFADLYEFMDKDKEFDRETLFDCVLEPFEVRGELPQLVTSMSLRTLAAKRANVPGDSWTVEQFLDWAEALPNGKYLTDYMNQTGMLNLLICRSIERFIDAERGKVDFDNDTFRRLLEYAKNTTDFNYRDTLSGDALADFNTDRYKAYREDIILLHEAHIYDLSGLVDAMFAFGFEDTAFIGYPTMEGSSGVVVTPNESYAILDDSPVADGAWEFVKSMLSPDSSMRGGRMNLSANREAFRAATAEDMKMHYFYYYDGGRSGSSSDDFFGRYDESEGIYRDFTDADVALMERMLDGAAAIPAYAEKFVELAMEDLEMYFAGEKTLDETIDIIESRVGLYIAENS